MMKKYVDEDMLSKKQDVKTLITSAETALTLKDNAEYRLTDISQLTLLYPEGSFEVWLRLSLSQTETVNIIFPVQTQYIGTAPVFGGGQTWEISIKDGVAVCWRIE